MLSQYSFHLFLIILLFNEVVSYEVIPKYGSIETYDKKVFLDTSGFNVGDKIYISITSYSEYNFDTFLRVGFYESIDDKDINSFRGDEEISYSTYSSKSTYTSYEETYNYKIEKNKENGNYLYMEYYLHTPVKIENTENDSSEIIIILSVIFSVIFITVIIVIIICCCRRCRRTAAYPVGTSLYPSSLAYGVSPYVPQPGIVMQPVVNVQPYDNGYVPDPNYAYPQSPQYNQNVKYDQSGVIGEGSESRMDDKTSNFEKPK